jgi:hypothetical protein
MLQIEDKIVSFDVLEKKFVCNLTVCKGICCVDGDAGAPLEKEELKLIKKYFKKIKKYLPQKNLEEIERQGLYIIDEDGDYVTPCIDGKECVYVVKDEKGIYKCAFEIAFRKGEINFIKPISCHLYPIRLSKFENFTGVNYEERNICAAARILGNKNNVKVYEFLKEPLTRAFGEDWYEQLDYAAKNYKIEK